MTDVLTSTTAKFWLMLFGVAFGFIVFVFAIQTFAHAEVPLVNEFFNLLGLGGGAQTARNVTAGHIVPAWQQSKTQTPPQPVVPGNLADPPR